MQKAVRALLALAPTLDDQLRLLESLASAPAGHAVAEIREHVAHRNAFLLLGHLMDAQSYAVIEGRLHRLFSREVPPELTEALAHTVVSVESSFVARRSGLADVPYPARRRMFARQNWRCSHCGWDFRNADDVEGATDRYATLDHIVPYRLAGDGAENHRILCAICNVTKEAALHVGEQGRTWLNNHVYAPPASRRVVYWAIARAQSRCEEPDCSHSAQTARLLVRRREERCAWILDNTRVVCETHAVAYDVIGR